jgi:hypothetical protein
MGWGHLGRFDVARRRHYPARDIGTPPDRALIRAYAVRMFKFPLDFRSE